MTGPEQPARVGHALQVADAILYEGYLLYPYRQSAAKNQARFQFGVLMPPSYTAVDSSERSASQTECLLECPGDSRIWVLARFLHLRRRTVQAVAPATGELRDVDRLHADGLDYTCWDEAAQQEHRLSAALGSALGQEVQARFHIDGGEDVQEVRGIKSESAGRLTWRWAPLDGTISVRAERLPGPYQALRLRVQLENRTYPARRLRNRADALPHALIAAHMLIGVPDGKFLSMTDPPEWAAAEVAACANIGTWPVLAGPPGGEDLVLSSPVILYDHPEIARESAGALFDATEIDEILTLRTLALTDAERQQARSTDPRAAELIDRLDHLPPEMLERLHGAIRYLNPASSGKEATAARPSGDAAAAPSIKPDTSPQAAPRTAQRPGPARAPWWDPGSDTSVSPETDHVDVGGVRIARGSRVRMRPGTRRADAQDLFLNGREAVVEAVLFDVDGGTHLALSIPDDPAAELQRSHGRFLYFAPDEIEPIGPAEPRDPAVRKLRP